ncbi:vancomycin resistance protein YoaR [Bacillus tianshenii]|uniref:Vancomycin resistance protein YoaR n=1 Tax=Sutcliffiella tianshenii TaxID=1463404 RepID=A0ABS2P0K9_9BACI|nr:VanW family protein [Bacillus tianshenii]MBM7619970.1 vancomycin resistance protein YoaR [Bacillus tianshenii]
MIQIWLAGLLLLAQPVGHSSNSLIITQEGQQITTMEREEFAMPLPGTPIINDDKYKEFVEMLDQKIYRAPQNAVINEHGGIASEKIGYKLNRRAFKEKFYEYFYSNGPAKMEVPLSEIYPRVDSELLSNIRIKQIGQYVTYFNSYNKSRSHNIFLAANAIDNHVIFPNETFSFNKVVGKRTIEKGYLRAPIIVRGELSEGVGGGICQVSSTLYNAVDRAGLKIVERYSHSRNVPYVPAGRDATVSWYGPDFRFQNQYNQPILIRAKRYGGSMIVTLYSSDVINYEPRVVPRAASTLPEEINIELTER